MPREQSSRGRPRAAFLLTGARHHLVAGSVAGLLAVAAGAFGAHGLRGVLDPGRLAVFHTGVEYQMYHALALCALGWRQAGTAAEVHFVRAGNCFVAGIVLFSGSLYALALGAPGALGMVTPLGGVLFLLGWALCIAGALHHER